VAGGFTEPSSSSCRVRLDRARALELRTLADSKNRRKAQNDAIRDWRKELEMGAPQEVSGPDLTAGVAEKELEAGRPLLGHVGDEPVVVVRTDSGIHAVGGSCTHYGGPLADGLVVDDTIRCPWHHACFSLRSGTALGAPALDGVDCWNVERVDGRIVVREKREVAQARAGGRNRPESVTIIGAGAAGHAAAEALRREGYEGPVRLIDRDAEAPYDRPNLSKDYLSGDAPDEWVRLRPESYFEEHAIERIFDDVTDLDLERRVLALEGGREVEFDRLLIATGASARAFPGDLPEDVSVHTLRTWSDSRALIAEAEHGKDAVVVGASFIGLEVAASLRARGVSVYVVAPEDVPMATTLGKELGSFVRQLHEDRGVQFRLGRTVARLKPTGGVVLDDGQELEADFVVVGIGVQPRDGLAREAGLQTDDGIVVDRYLAAAEGVYAAGDVARFPDPQSGQLMRIEHWAVAQRMGQCAARNLLGAEEPFTDVPFFWSRHYDHTIAYVGAAGAWDDVSIDGSPSDNDCAVEYRRDGKVRALATVGRDLESLRFEAEMERRNARAKERR
jgi:NADPH-dependent 2,4-dienoyl-CoA reductase/sulfur reductase-like enzyme/nitrite reductase/ring-hydroxylating ferredoxin subunit